MLRRFSSIYYYLLYQYFLVNLHSHKIGRCFVSALIKFYKNNCMFRMFNGILKLFHCKIFRINTCFFINIIRVCMWFLNYIFSINMFLNLSLTSTLFLGKSSGWKISSSSRLSGFLQASYIMYYASNGSLIGSSTFW